MLKIFAIVPIPSVPIRPGVCLCHGLSPCPLLGDKLLVNSNHDLFMFDPLEQQIPNRLKENNPK